MKAGFIMEAKDYDCCWLAHSSYCPECVGQICTVRPLTSEEKELLKQKQLNKCEKPMLIVKECTQ